MAELERMVGQKVQSLHERVKAKEDTFRVRAPQPCSRGSLRHSCYLAKLSLSHATEVHCLPSSAGQDCLCGVPSCLQWRSHAEQQQRGQQCAASGSALRRGAGLVQEEVLGMEGGLAEAQAAFATLDAQMSRESQTAAKIGDRLHVRHLLHLGTLPCVNLWFCLRYEKLSWQEVSKLSRSGKGSPSVVNLHLVHASAWRTHCPAGCHPVPGCHVRALPYLKARQRVTHGHVPALGAAAGLATT